MDTLDPKASFENYDGCKLYNFSINDDKYKINQNPESLIRLTNFDNLVPFYDESIGYHLKLNDKGTTKIVSLSVCVIGRTLFPEIVNGVGTETMSINQISNLICEIKKKHVDELIRNVYAFGFEMPSVSQALGIIPLINGKDMIIQFKSGTGKTCTFLIGLLWGFDPADPSLQYIFLTSTHEVATQIHQIACLLLPNANISLCKGGAKTQAGGFKSEGPRGNLDEKRSELRKAQIIVGTIGKTYELLCVKHMVHSFDNVKAICLDEFDQLLNPQKSRGSSYEIRTEDQVKCIFNDISPYAQRVFFSATVIKGSDETARSYFRSYDEDYGDPFMVLLDSENYLLKGIRHYYVIFDMQENKYAVLLELLRKVRITQTIIFVNRTDHAYRLQAYLDGEKVQSALFHGGLDGPTRQKIFDDFKAGHFRYLIATDVLARGIDVHQINVVINFDMPEEKESYIHRIGRSGRFGRKGVAINFVMVNREMDEMQKVQAINAHGEMNKMVPLPNNLEDLL